MKYLKPYNESIKDQMTPKPKEDIVNDLKKLSPNKKILVGYEYELLWLIKLGLEEGGEFSEHAGYLLMDFAKVNDREDIIELLKSKGVDAGVDMSIINKVIPNRKVNESVRDFMTPKSKEDMRKYIDTLVPGERLKKGIEFGVLSRTEARDMIDRLSPEYKLIYGKKYGLLSPREIHELFLPLTLIEKIRFMRLNYYRYSSDKLKEDFLTLTKQEKKDIIDYGIDSSLLSNKTVMWRYTYSDNNLLESFDKMLKRLRKVSSNTIKNDKRWGRNNIAYVNEGVRDLMTPKSEENIFKDISKLPLDNRLIKGAQQGSLSVVKKALQDGADIHTEQDKPLTAACYNGYVEIAKFLIDNGADIHIQNDTCLYFACVHGKTDIVRLLLDLGVDPDAREGECIERAVFFNHIEIVKMLLDEGAELHRNNDRLLQRAVINHHEAIVELLISRGAFMSVVGPSALSYANDTDDHKIPKIVSKYTIKREYKMNEGVRDKMTPISSEDMTKRAENMTPKQLIDAGVNSDSLWLIKNGIKNLKNKYEFSNAFKSAVDELQIDIVKYFIDSNLVTLKDIKDALHVAKITQTYIKGNHHKSKEKDEMYKLLQKKIDEKINEGLRDKMTPKPTDAIKKGMRKYFKDSKVLNKDEFVKETGVFDNLDNLYLVFDYEDYYEEIDTYFKKMVKGEEQFEMTIHGDTYKCYPKQKLVDFYDNTLTGAWYFERDKIDGIIQYIIENM